MLFELSGSFDVNNSIILEFYPFILCHHGFFGPGCQYRCHCDKSCDCDSVVGCTDCDEADGCCERYTGFPRCQGVSHSRMCAVIIHSPLRSGISQVTLITIEFKSFEFGFSHDLRSNNIILQDSM